MAGSELLIYVLIAGAILLFNVVMPRLAKRARQEERAAQAQGAPSPPDDEPLEDIWGRTQATPLEIAAPPPRTQAEQSRTEQARALPERRASAEPLFRTKQDLRHAVVAMTVLGPCRALEPPESR